jgi:hypothetical protein
MKIEIDLDDIFRDEYGNSEGCRVCSQATCSKTWP